MEQQKNYFLGLDIGTDSVGYAVTDEDYALLKFRGEPMWGVQLFKPGSLNEDRRKYRTARRRLDRRQQRVKLVQELFAKEIAKVDRHFYRRLAESALWREDAQEPYCLFADAEYTDAEYHKQYPTIHHLILELMKSEEVHDVRLVYLACAWLVAHRGHFFSDVSKDRIEDMTNVQKTYEDLFELFDGVAPWVCDAEAFGNVLKKKIGFSAKYRELCQLLYQVPKIPKSKQTETEPSYGIEPMIRLLCGGTAAAKDLFGKDEYAEVSSFTLDKADDDLALILSELSEEDAELIRRLKALFDWAVLADILSGGHSVSEKKVEIYEQHKADLALLKRLVRKYVPEKYKEVFRDESKPGYASYSGSGKYEDFAKYIRAFFKNTVPDGGDTAEFERMMAGLEAGTFCPKQVTSDNRVIPYQVYWVELKQILDNAAAYLPFLREADGEGYVTADKILSIMEFRVPYFVGPLNRQSSYSWVCRKADGKIFPWNFDQMVDPDGSEQAFIDRMTNSCTYLPHAKVLPKGSLLHEKFQVLNEINTLSVYGKRISAELKQQIYLKVFAEKKRVSLKAIKEYLLLSGAYTRSDLDTLSGIDETVKSSLSTARAFRHLMATGQLTEADAEEIVKRSTYTEDRTRFAAWVDKTYPALSEADRRYVSKLKFKDFARLSEELLCQIYGTESDSETGEATSIIERMWNENVNLMEILSERYTYRAQIEAVNAAYYREHAKGLDERMEEMCISNAVKRPIIRTLDIVADVVKANGGAPRKIFVEMARGGKPEEKGKRTVSRYRQLKELYARCELEDAREMEKRLDAMGDDRDNRLQSEKLFLYYLQLGRSMYSYTPIDPERLSDKCYDIDHIYPQSKVKDDSVWNNKVLVLSEENGAKGDCYPISGEIRQKMHSWWKQLLDLKFITPEKYKRLTRHTPFDENEEWGFINRQLVETRQSTKAVATLLKERYPETEIVYVKAGLVSEFRQEFDMLKSRAVNDLHHAKDAYLNVVVGNVYSEQFTRKWFMANRDKYNLKVSTLFSRRVTAGGDRVVWNGCESIGKVKHIVHCKNAIHLTYYSSCCHGALFKQQPKSRKEGTVPRKAGLPVEKYGGYCETTAAFYVIAKYRLEKKTEVMLVPIELMVARRFDSDGDFACAYIKSAIETIIGKPIDTIDFPMGMRKIKIKTMLELDGLRMCISGKANGGKTVILSLICPLIVGYSWEKYIKRLERFVQKKKENPQMIYNQLFDQITAEQNVVLYDLLTEKLGSKLYSHRPNNPLKTLRSGREKFVGADIWNQTQCLMQILTVFGKVSDGCDLQTVGGAKNAAATKGFSASMSNWKKYYSDVRIIDQSASGLFECRSDNLLELL